MRVFVTGGSGFVGQHLIRRLREEGHTPIALARSERSADIVRGAGADAVSGDLDDLTATGDVTRDPAWVGELSTVDAVVHAAARMEFWGPDEGFRTDNHEPTIALHAAAAKAGVSRFVLISAAGISTGTQRARVVDEGTDDGVSMIAYGRVKLATENALRDAPTPGMALVILRPPFIWGPGLTTMSDAVAAARKGRWVWIDHGRHTMDFVHVLNLADAIVDSLTHGRDGALYYVTDGAPTSVREFFGALFATQGVDLSRARSIPLWVASPVAAALDGAARLLRRPTAPPLTNWLVANMGRDRAYDISAARADLGYHPRLTVAEGMRGMTA